MYETWQNDDDATKWAVQTGVFSGGGHLLALALEEVKGKGGDFYPAWHQHVTGLMEARKAGAS